MSNSLQTWLLRRKSRSSVDICKYCGITRRNLTVFSLPEFRSLGGSLTSEFCPFFCTFFEVLFFGPLDVKFFSDFSFFLSISIPKFRSKNFVLFRGTRRALADLRRRRHSRSTFYYATRILNLVFNLHILKLFEWLYQTFVLYYATFKST